MTFRVRRFGVWIVAAMASLAAAHAQSGAAKPRRIAVFGSSVANGTGDEYAKEGHTGRLRELLAPRGWDVLNQSRGGANTIRMAPRFAPENQPEPNVRYLPPVNPTYICRRSIRRTCSSICHWATKAFATSRRAPRRK